MSANKIYSAKDFTEDCCLTEVQSCLSRCRQFEGEEEQKLLQDFAKIVRAYIVAPANPEQSKYRDESWWYDYRRKRDALYLAWKLRGGICRPEHVRECFRWIDKESEGKELLSKFADLLEITPLEACYLSWLDEKSRKSLSCSWILKWQVHEKYANQNTIVGKLFEDDPTKGTFPSTSLGTTSKLRHVFRVLYPGEVKDRIQNPPILCKALRKGNQDTPVQSGDTYYKASALKHVMDGSSANAEGRWISTTVDLKVAQSFSGLFYGQVALIYLGDMVDASTKVQNLIDINNLKHLDEEGRPARHMEFFESVRTRVVRSQEVLIFEQIQPDCVRLLTPCMKQKSCRNWPFECRDDFGVGFRHLKSLNKAFRVSGKMPSPEVISQALSEENSPLSVRHIRPLCGPNDGLSLIECDGVQYLLKRAKPNVENLQMLSATDMRLQLKVAWVAYAISCSILNTHIPFDFPFCLYEYEAFFLDFKDPDRDGKFLWNSECQTWEGAFLLFEWPQSDEQISAELQPAEDLLVDCLLGVKTFQVDTRIKEWEKETEPNFQLTHSQKRLLRRVLKLDYALGGVAIERTKRNDFFLRSESVLLLLKEGLPQDLVFSDASDEYDTKLRSIIYDHCKIANFLQQDPKNKASLDILFSLLDGIRYRGKLLADNVKSLLNDRINELKSFEQLLQTESRSSSRRPGMLRSSVSNAAVNRYECGVMAAINAALENSRQRVALLFGEPFEKSTHHPSMPSKQLRRQCFFCEELKSSFIADPLLNNVIDVSVYVATHDSLIEAAQNHSVVLLNSPVDTTNKYTAFKLWLEVENLSSTDRNLVNAKSYTIHTDRTVPEDIFEHLDRSGLKILFVISCESSVDPAEHVISEWDLNFAMIFLKGAEKFLNEFVMNFLKASADDIPCDIAFRSTTLRNRRVEARLMKPKNMLPHVKMKQPTEAKREEAFDTNNRTKSVLQAPLPAFGMMTGRKVSEILGEIFLRLSNPYSEPRHIYFNSHSVHLDSFIMWHKAETEVLGHGVQVLNIFGLPGDSGVSALILELVKYVQYRRGKIINLKLMTRNMDDRDSQGWDHMDDSLCSGLDEDSSVVRFPEYFTEHDAQHHLLCLLRSTGLESITGGTLMIDACSMNELALTNLMSFPSKFLDVVGANGIKLVIFHTTEDCGPDSFSFVHYRDQPKEGQLLCLDAKQHSNFFADKVDRMPFSDPEIKEVLYDNGLTLSEGQLNAILKSVDLESRLRTKDVIEICRYILDISDRRADPRIDANWLDEVVARCREIRGDMRSETERTIDSDFSQVDAISNVLERAKLKVRCNTASNAFEILRPVALLPESNLSQIISDVNSSIAFSSEDEILCFTFKCLSLDLQQALLFCMIFPENTDIDASFLDDDGFDSKCKAALLKSRDATTFWEECWLAALTYISSDSAPSRLATAILTNSLTPSNSSRSRLLFQWLRDVGIIITPLREKQTFIFSLRCLEERGLLVSHGQKYRIPMQIRKMCAGQRTMLLQDDDYKKVVTARELLLVKIVVLRLSSTHDRTCSKIFSKNRDLWRWAIIQMLHKKTITPKTCRKVAKLLWFVRRPLRDIRLQLKLSNGDTNFDSVISGWAESAAEKLTSVTLRAEIVRDIASCKNLIKNLIAIAQCHHICAIVKREVTMCGNAEIAIGRAKEVLAQNAELTRYRLHLSVCAAEVYLLHARLHAESLKDRGRKRSNCKQMIPSIKEKFNAAERELEAAEELFKESCFCMKTVSGSADPVKYCTCRKLFSQINSEMLNFQGNFYLHNAGMQSAAVEKYKLAMELSTGFDSSRDSDGNFYSHNYALALFRFYQDKNADGGKEHLMNAFQHLCNAIRFRSKEANSKIFESILRLCDSHRTMTSVLNQLKVDFPGDEAVESMMKEYESEMSSIDKEKVIVVKLLRECAKMADSKAQAREWLREWMISTSFFAMPHCGSCHTLIQVFESNSRRKKSKTGSRERKFKNEFFFQFEQFEQAKTELDFLAELLKTWRSFLLESGLDVFILLMDPVCRCMEYMAVTCLERSLSLSDFQHAVNIVKSLVVDPEKSCARDRNWQMRVVRLLKSLLEKWNGLIADGSTAVPDLTTSHIPGSHFLADPVVYLACLLYAPLDLFVKEERKKLLHICMTLVVAKALLKSSTTLECDQDIQKILLLWHVFSHDQHSLSEDCMSWILNGCAIDVEHRSGQWVRASVKAQGIVTSFWVLSKFSFSDCDSGYFDSCSQIECILFQVEIFLERPDRRDATSDLAAIRKQIRRLNDLLGPDSPTYQNIVLSCEITEKVRKDISKVFKAVAEKFCVNLKIKDFWQTFFFDTSADGDVETILEVLRLDHAIKRLVGTAENIPRDIQQNASSLIYKNQEFPTEFVQCLQSKSKAIYQNFSGKNRISSDYFRRGLDRLREAVETLAKAGRIEKANLQETITKDVQQWRTAVDRGDIALNEMGLFKDCQEFFYRSLLCLDSLGRWTEDDDQQGLDALLVCCLEWLVEEEYRSAKAEHRTAKTKECTESWKDRGICNDTEIIMGELTLIWLLCSMQGCWKWPAAASSCMKECLQSCNFGTVTNNVDIGSASGNPNAEAQAAVGSGSSGLLQLRRVALEACRTLPSRLSAMLKDSADLQTAQLEGGASVEDGVLGV